MKTPKKPIAVTVADLSDGSLHEFGTITEAAAFMDVSFSQAKRMMMTRSLYKKYFVYRLGRDAENSETVAAMRSYYQRHGSLAKAKPVSTELVSLRIDRHTVILVTPDKATPEYAQQWREKYEKAGKREASWNSKTSFE